MFSKSLLLARDCGRTWEDPSQVTISAMHSLMVAKGFPPPSDLSRTAALWPQSPGLNSFSEAPRQCNARASWACPHHRNDTQCWWHRMPPVIQVRHIQIPRYKGKKPTVTSVHFTKQLKRGMTVSNHGLVHCDRHSDPGSQGFHWRPPVNGC